MNSRLPARVHRSAHTADGIHGARSSATPLQGATDAQRSDGESQDQREERGHQRRNDVRVDVEVEERHPKHDEGRRPPPRRLAALPHELRQQEEGQRDRRTERQEPDGERPTEERHAREDGEPRIAAERAQQPCRRERIGDRDDGEQESVCHDGATRDESEQRTGEVVEQVLAAHRIDPPGRCRHGVPAEQTGHHADRRLVLGQIGDRREALERQWQPCHERKEDEQRGEATSRQRRSGRDVRRQCEHDACARRERRRRARRRSRHRRRQGSRQAKRCSLRSSSRACPSGWERSLRCRWSSRRSIPDRRSSNRRRKRRRFRRSCRNRRSRRSHRNRHTGPNRTDSVISGSLKPTAQPTTEEVTPSTPTARTGETRRRGRREPREARIIGSHRARTMPATPGLDSVGARARVCQQQTPRPVVTLGPLRWAASSLGSRSPPPPSSLPRRAPAPPAPSRPAPRPFPPSRSSSRGSPRVRTAP